MLRGKKRTIELVQNLGELEVNIPGVAYTAGCASYVLVTSMALLALAWRGSSAPLVVAVTYVADIAVAIVVLAGMYERRILYAPYVVCC